MILLSWSGWVTFLPFKRKKLFGLVLLCPRLCGFMVTVRLTSTALATTKMITNAIIFRIVDVLLLRFICRWQSNKLRECLLFLNLRILTNTHVHLHALNSATTWLSPDLHLIFMWSSLEARLWWLLAALCNSPLCWLKVSFNIYLELV